MTDFERLRNLIEFERVTNHGGLIDFAKNRLDHIAVWVTEWMPPEDNEQHHNAVEHCLRIAQTLDLIKERCEWALDEIHRLNSAVTPYPVPLAEPLTQGRNDAT